MEKKMCAGGRTFSCHRKTEKTAHGRAQSPTVVHVYPNHRSQILGKTRILEKLEILCLLPRKRFVETAHKPNHICISVSEANQVKLGISGEHRKNCQTNNVKYFHSLTAYEEPS